MTVLITGANGWIGGRLADRLLGRGTHVTGVSRTPEAARARRPEVDWIGVGDELEAAVRRADAVVNLAGRHPFEQRWDADYERAMYESRIGITRRIAGALRDDAVLVSGSGYPVYGDAGEAEVTEDHVVSRATFAARLDVDWERAAAVRGRLVIVRIGLALEQDGGALPVLIRPTEDGAGTVLGTGDQWVPWIHVDDLVDLLVAAVDDPRWSGVFNACSPAPVRHRELIEAVHSRTVQVPAAVVEAELGGVAELVLSSTRMVPRRALALGHRFAHPDLRSALGAIFAGA